MSGDLKSTVTVIFKLIDGEPMDEDWVLDAFAAAIGKANGARPPLRLNVKTDPMTERPTAVYEVDLID